MSKLSERRTAQPEALGVGGGLYLEHVTGDLIAVRRQERVQVVAVDRRAALESKCRGERRRPSQIAPAWQLIAARQAAGHDGHRRTAQPFGRGHDCGAQARFFRHRVDLMAERTSRTNEFGIHGRSSRLPNDRETDAGRGR